MATLLVVLESAGFVRAAPPEVAGGNQAAASDQALEADRKMRAFLAEIATRTSGVIPLVPPGYRAQLDSQFAQLTAQSPLGPFLDVHLRLAQAEMWAGRNARAIELLKAALARFPEGSVTQEASPEGRDLVLFWLGVAHLRDGEQKNCVGHHSSESCIIPLRGSGVHQDRAPGQEAIRVFQEVLSGEESKPDWLVAASTWLLNVAYMAVGEYPQGVPPKLRLELPQDGAFPRFREIAGSLGLAVFDLAGGVVVEDFDQDGFLDVMFSTWDPSGSLRLFVSDGNGGFEDRTEPARLGDLPGGLNLTHADYDGDGDLDVLVLRGAWLGERGRHPNSLLRNDGDGTFTDITFVAGLGDVHYPTQAAAWADYDLDGDLDVYIANEGGFADRTAQYPNQLFRNEGDGTFTDIAGEAGVADRGFAKAGTWGDYDSDGDPDLFVSNLGGPNRLYRNLGDGRFEDVAAKLGLTEPIRSFAAWFWDYDNDGALDLFVTSYPVDNLVRPERQDLGLVASGILGRETTGETHRLWKGDGKGSFTEVTKAQGLDRVTLPMGVNFGDLDNDGYLDLYLATGYPGVEALMPNVMYVNENGRGKGFRDVTVPGAFGHLQKGHGVAFADLDNDGDQDVVNQLGGFYASDRFANTVYENPGFGRHWIVLELSGDGANRFGLGAHVRVDVSENGKTRSIHRWVGSGATFGSNPFRQEIGLGAASTVDRVEIRWPGGGTQSFEDLEADRFYRIREGKSEVETLVRRRLRFAGAEGPAASPQP